MKNILYRYRKCKTCDGFIARSVINRVLLYEINSSISWIYILLQFIVSLRLREMKILATLIF